MRSSRASPRCRAPTCRRPTCAPARRSCLPASSRRARPACTKHIDRGYEDYVGKLRGLGATIDRRAVDGDR